VNKILGRRFKTLFCKEFAVFTSVAHANDVEGVAPDRCSTRWSFPVRAGLRFEHGDRAETVGMADDGAALFDQAIDRILTQGLVRTRGGAGGDAG
jgi:hypothetical protein